MPATRDATPTPPPVPAPWLLDLWAYAQAQARTPAGGAAVAALPPEGGEEVPTLGYLPPDYLEAVPSAQQSWCRDHLIPGVVMAVYRDDCLIGLEPFTGHRHQVDCNGDKPSDWQPLPPEANADCQWVTNGLIRLGLQTPAGGNVRLLIARRGDRVHKDRLDVTIAAQVNRFARSAAARCETTVEALTGGIVALWAVVTAQEEADTRPAAMAIAESDRTGAMARLQSPTLLADIADDLTALGWAGDTPTKQYLYLTAISRFLAQPLWTVSQASAGAQPWHDLALLTSLVPPEDRLVFHRLTESQLRQGDPNAFRHRLLLIDRAETLRPEAALALRVLQERGGIAWQTLAPLEGAGRFGHRPTILSEVRGPVAVLAAATGLLDARCRDGFVVLTADESAAQTARIHAAHLRARAGQTDVRSAARLQEAHWSMQRTLARDAVCIPFAHRIRFPVGSVRFRRELGVFLTLIEASAFLHQYQRSRDAEGRITATETDYHHAHACAGHVLGQEAGGLGAAARTLLQALTLHGVADFTMRDLPRWWPDATRHAFRSALADLTDLGYVAASPGGRGEERTYTVTPMAPAAAGITLLPEDASPVRAGVGELEVVGADRSPTANPVGKVG